MKNVKELVAKEIYKIAKELVATNNELVKVVRGAKASWMENFKITNKSDDKVSVSFVYGAKTVNPFEFSFDVIMNPKAGTVDNWGIKALPYIVSGNCVFTGKKSFGDSKKLKDIIKYGVGKAVGGWKISAVITADTDYIYDPEHKKHPSGGYVKTEKGWTKNKKDEESGNKSKNEKTYSQKYLHQKASDKSQAVREWVAKNPETLPVTLNKLSNDESSFVRGFVAIHKNVPLKTLEKLSNDEHEMVREAVAQNPKVTQNILEKLSNDEYYGVRMWAAKSKNASPEMLDKLSNDEDYMPRMSVAGNKNTSLETLEKLSNDSYDEVRRSVAANRNTPTKILIKLSKDKSPDVRFWVASNSNTPTDMLNKFLSSDVSVRKGVAANKQATSKMLDKLSNDKNEDVRGFVVSNPRISNETLKKLSVDKTDWIAKKATNTIKERNEIRKTNEYKTMKKYEQAMDKNDRYTAFKAVANYFGDSNSVKQLSEIEKEHDKIGYLTEELNEKRYPIINKLIERMKTEKNEQFQSARSLAHTDSINNDFQEDVHFDITKLSPELREKVKDWDAEDIAKFIGWLKQQKEEGQE